ncbi:MAG TPA: S46 family peptidase [Steroidobacteraceae bacterium]|nr:S46 family peptidase [Steroidobacteraceae bacterium]
MQMKMRYLFAAALFALAQSASADEGMWTFDNFPRTTVKEKYGVDVTQPWLNRIQRAITRHEVGCTGSFISPQGLVLTNHHCVMDCLADISSSSKDLVGEGINAKTRGEELTCPGEIISVLIETENVTDKVNKATAGLSDAKANEARKSELSRLEASCTEAAKKNRATGPLACEAVNLYQGGQYFLYKYKRYNDVRIVFAPHDAIAAFGGDPDNFNFPRWSLDFSLMRVYENNQPAKTPDYLRWRNEGPKAGEPVFVAGHPGTTNRLWTTSQLKFNRDTFIPAFLARYTELRGRLIQWSKTGDEPLRIAQDSLLSYENSLKVYRGLHRALLDDSLLAEKSKQEQSLRSKISADANLAPLADSWTQIERAQDRYRQIYYRYAYLELAHGFHSKLFNFARSLVRGAAERPKPNQERLREFAESNLGKTSSSLLSDVPVYPDYEQLTLSFSLDKMRENLGPDDVIVRKLMSAESPDSLARKLIEGSKLGDAKVRRELWEGGAAAIAASNDPMIVLAREIDADARAVRKTYEDEVQGPVAANQEKIAKARFAMLGTNTYPDATFTLRMSYGAVESWTENGTEIPNFTRLNRLYERTTGKAPFALPPIWLDARSKLDPNTPFNYVTTNDIIGGNSGSPVIDAQGRLVGLAFDGNIHSIAGSYWYNPKLNRMVAVHPQMIITTLRDVYPANALAQEILGSE